MVRVIIKLEFGAIVRHYLRNSTFSRFDTVLECDRQTHDDGIYCTSIASCGKKLSSLERIKDNNGYITTL